MQAERQTESPLPAGLEEPITAYVRGLIAAGYSARTVKASGGDLRQFAAFVDERVPWAHVDLAGPAWQDKAGPLGPRGATGYGARLLARLVELLVS
mgnify:CR=1 FL=1